MFLIVFKITHLKPPKFVKLVILMLTIYTHVAITWLYLNIHHTPFNKVKPLVSNSFNLEN